jgi:hypothetical protein
VTPPRFHKGHDKTDLGSELDLIADHGVLPFGHDSVSAVDMAADQVFEEVVAVEPAAPLPQLGDPRPYLTGRSAHGDGAGCYEVWIGDQVIAGQGLAGLLTGRAPPQLPTSGQEDAGGRRASKSGYTHDMPASHSVPPARGRYSPLASYTPGARRHPHLPRSVHGDGCWPVSSRVSRWSLRRPYAWRL